MKKAKHQHPDYTINTRLFDDYLERMNFLNEVSIINPHAISFGSGRPDKDFFDVRQENGLYRYICVQRCGVLPSKLVSK